MTTDYEPIGPSRIFNWDPCYLFAYRACEAFESVPFGVSNNPQELWDIFMSSPARIGLFWVADKLRYYARVFKLSATDFNDITFDQDLFSRVEGSTNPDHEGPPDEDEDAFDTLYYNLYNLDTWVRESGNDLPEAQGVQIMTDLLRVWTVVWQAGVELCGWTEYAAGLWKLARDEGRHPSLARYRMESGVAAATERQ